MENLFITFYVHFRRVFVEFGILLTKICPKIGYLLLQLKEIFNEQGHELFLARYSKS